MRVLLLEPDTQVRGLVRRSLEPEGHEVLALANAEQALALLRARTAEVIICALEPGTSEGGTFLRQARPMLGSTSGLVMSAFYTADDPELGAAMAAFGRSEFLAKPFTLPDLAERVRRLSRGLDRRPPPPARPIERPTGLPVVSPPTPPPIARRVVDPRNLQLLTRLWLSRATGTVCLVSGADGAEGWASLKGGGPVDEESRRLLDKGLFGGELSFEAVDISAPGDWEGMGQLLWRVVRDPSQRRFALENRFQALARTSWTGAASHLPLANATRNLLAQADGNLTLGEAMARGGVDAEVVSPELHALAQMRLVTLQAPLLAQGRRSDTPSNPLAGASGTASLPVDRPLYGASSGTSSSTRTRAPSPLPTPSSARTSESASISTLTPTSAGSPLRQQSRTVEASNAPLRSNQATRSRMTGTSSEVTHARTQIRQVLLRLRREAGDLGTASPAVVLGVPGDASSELVQEAAARMRARYANMANDEALPQEARELAGQILERVEEAARTFGKARAANAAAAMDEERLLAVGKELMAQRQWEQAERVLGRARQLKADHPGILANLAWAHLNNPARGPEARATEARELLLLAEQFDPQHGEGQYYLAELLYRLGEYASALPRAERALRSTPENAAVASLARKLRARLAAGS